MVAGFNISNKYVVSVGLELPNPLEETHFTHWEVFAGSKTKLGRQKRTAKCLCSRKESVCCADRWVARDRVTP